MVTGLSGKTGATVLSRVAAECRIGQGLVPTPHRHLEESRARVILTKHVRVTNSLAQVNKCLSTVRLNRGSAVDKLCSASKQFLSMFRATASVARKPSLRMKFCLSHIHPQLSH